MLIIRKAKLDDAYHFVELILISAPFFPLLFGDNIKKALITLFQHRSNLFSFEHVYFAEISGKVVGMILGYDWKAKRKEDFKTGLLLFKNIGISLLTKLLTLIKFKMTVGSLAEGEYYISNIAVYPEQRGKGIGRKLISKVEKQAKAKGTKTMVLDVEKDNINAINFYKKIGYEIMREFSIKLKDKELQFFRMAKKI